MRVLIGIDPRKATNAVAAIDERGGVARVCRLRHQQGRLRSLARWSRRFLNRRWAVEGAGGLGRSVAQRQKLDDVRHVALKSSAVLKVGEALGAMLHSPAHKRLRVSSRDEPKVRYRPPRCARTIAPLAGLEQSHLPGVRLFFVVSKNLNVVDEPAKPLPTPIKS